MIGAATTVALAAAVVGGLIALSQSTSDNYLSCASSPKSFLSGSDFGAFASLIDAPFSEPPIGVERNPQLRVSWLGGRLIGMINSIVLTGKYRAENDAYARSFGYQVGSQPLVPLVGSVVLDTPGPLETYESHYVFSSKTAAKEWLVQSEMSDFAAGHVPTAVGDGGIAVHGVMQPDDGKHETFAAVYATWSNIGYTLKVLGGKQVSVGLVVGDANLGIQDVIRHCEVEAS